jgi:exopolyphosphatase/guanosine-5'-triphosphate,3'-diphosphate pyrophosphatase
LFDIGGGSSDCASSISVVSARRGWPRTSSWTSLPLGVVSLAERFGGKVVSGEVFEAMVADVRRHLKPLPVATG